MSCLDFVNTKYPSWKSLLNFTLSPSPPPAAIPRQKLFWTHRMRWLGDLVTLQRDSLPSSCLELFVILPHYYHFPFLEGGAVLPDKTNVLLHLSCWMNTSLPPPPQKKEKALSLVSIILNFQSQEMKMSYMYLPRKSFSLWWIRNLAHSDWIGSMKYIFLGLVLRPPKTKKGAQYWVK